MRKLFQSPWFVVLNELFESFRYFKSGSKFAVVPLFNRRNKVGLPLNGRFQDRACRPPDLRKNEFASLQMPAMSSLSVATHVAMAFEIPLHLRQKFAFVIHESGAYSTGKLHLQGTFDY
jgi:hypothetical protein